MVETKNIIELNDNELCRISGGYLSIGYGVGNRKADMIAASVSSGAVSLFMIAGFIAFGAQLISNLSKH